MKISRPDVSSSVIEETKNFIKLPIKPYLDLLQVTPVPSQVALINAINKYRFVVAAISRRQGKTFAANIIAQLIVLMPECHVLIMAPNYQLSQISFDIQRKLIKHFDLEVEKDNAKDRIIELSNGSTIRMGSINQVDSCVGRSYDLIVFDEAALSLDGQMAFEVSLRPTLDKPNARAIFISTPRGKHNWFAEFFNRGYSDDFKSWCSIHATYHDNPRESLENIEEAKISNTKAFFQQEYEADFTVFEGKIWLFDAEKCVADLSEMQRTKKWDIIAGLDVGFRDPTAFVIIAYDWEADLYYILEDYLLAERTTEQHAEAILEIMGRWDPDFVFIDSQAQQVKFDLAQNYGISTTNADKDVLAGIGFVGSLVENNKVIVDQSCRHVIESFDQYRWDPNQALQREKPAHDRFCHMADALRYGLYSFKTSSQIY